MVFKNFKIIIDKWLLRFLVKKFAFFMRIHKENESADLVCKSTLFFTEICKKNESETLPVIVYNQVYGWV